MFMFTLVAFMPALDIELMKIRVKDWPAAKPASRARTVCYTATVKIFIQGII